MQALWRVQGEGQGLDCALFTMISYAIVPELLAHVLACHIPQQPAPAEVTIAGFAISARVN